MKLTPQQRDVLDWIGSTFDGVTDITNQRVAINLLRKGLLSYDGFQDTWRITPAGRAALTDGERPDGE